MKLAVATLTIGPFYEEMAKLTHPRIRAYAEKIGADFVVMRDSGKWKIPHYNKLQLCDLLNKYDRIIYLDTDIVVRGDAPNLFETVPIEQLGAFNEARFTDRNVTFRVYLDSVGLDSRKWDGKYYNTGVLVLSARHKNLFSSIDKETDHFFEQSQINAEIARHRPTVFQLDYKLNRMSCCDQPTAEQRHDAYFIHYAGVSGQIGEKRTLEIIQKDMDILDASRPEYKFPKHVAISVQGGLGDQICAEPAIRYMRDHVYPGDDLIIQSDWPEIFSHLGLKTYGRKDPIQTEHAYRVLQSLRSPEHISWEFMSHPLVHGIDFCSLQLFRSILPVAAKTPKLTFTLEDLAALDAFCKVESLSSSVLLHPGRGWPSKTFPSDVWQSYADALCDAGYQVITVGKRIGDDQGVVEFDRSRCIDLTDRITLKQLFALIANVPVLISNDSAPIHIAGAFDNWIGLIATCKHPEYVLPWRNGSVYYKAKALEIATMYEDYSKQPTLDAGQTIDKCTETRMRECLPKPQHILDFINGTKR